MILPLPVARKLFAFARHLIDIPRHRIQAEVEACKLVFHYLDTLARGEFAIGTISIYRSIGIDRGCIREVLLCKLGMD